MPATRSQLRREKKQPAHWRHRRWGSEEEGEQERRSLEGSRIRIRMYREPSGAAPPHSRCTTEVLSMVHGLLWDVQACPGEGTMIGKMGRAGGGGGGPESWP